MPTANQLVRNLGEVHARGFGAARLRTATGRAEIGRREVDAEGRQPDERAQSVVSLSLTPTMPITSRRCYRRRWPTKSA